MDTLKIVSLNVKGLNTPEKRRMLLHDMCHSGADIVFLQETQGPCRRLRINSTRWYTIQNTRKLNQEGSLF